MFTGIIETTAKILERSATGLTLARPKTFDDIKEGSSIAVSGACLSVIRFNKKSMSFAVVPETWAKTKLGALKSGDAVNLERALAANGRFDGHVVQGHVEGVGTVVDIKKEREGATLTIDIPPPLLPFIIPKGSITLDGVSLTIASVNENLCTVALIPLTLQETTLGRLQKGDPVDIETDIFVRALYQFIMKNRQF